MDKVIERLVEAKEQADGPKGDTLEVPKERKNSAKKSSRASSRGSARGEEVKDGKDGKDGEDGKDGKDGKDAQSVDRVLKSQGSSDFTPFDNTENQIRFSALGKQAIDNQKA